MTIKLTDAFEKNLVLSITENLSDIKIGKDNILSLGQFDWANKLYEELPEESRKTIFRYCGENGLKYFLYHEVWSSLILEYGYGDIPRSRPLVEIQPFQNTVGYARQLVTTLSSIPRRYRATFALPRAFSTPLELEFPSPMQLSDQMMICRGSDLPQPFPTESSNPNIDQYLFSDFISSSPSDRDIDQDRLYISMILLGYGSHNHVSQLERNFEDTVKAFYGACFAAGILSNKYTSEKDGNQWVIFHDESGERSIISTESVDQDIREGTRNASSFAFAQISKTDIWQKLGIIMPEISTVFQDNAHSRRLFTACIWHYRATVTRRALDKLLEATIAIEVLLGDRSSAEGLGLTNLLGNRCAFLLGRSPSHREQIIKDFSRVYMLRSSVVHAGKLKLEEGENEIVKKGVQLCGEIIAREMRIAAKKAV